MARRVEVPEGVWGELGRKRSEGGGGSAVFGRPGWGAKGGEESDGPAPSLFRPQSHVGFGARVTRGRAGFGPPLAPPPAFAPPQRLGGLTRHAQSVPQLFQSRPGPFDGPPPPLPHKEASLSQVLMASGEARTKESRFQPGSVVCGRFKILSKFSGAGKCPEMFFGREEWLGRAGQVKDVVIKVCAEAEEKKMQRLSREIEILRYLKGSDSSRSIQTLIFDAHTTGQDAARFGQVLLMASLAKGEDLHTLVQKHHSFDLPSTLYIADQIFDAFEYIHKKGIIHRDIKPSNIVSGRREEKDFNLYMIDFDLAVNIYEQDAYGLTRHYGFEQKKGHRVGNPNYRTRHMHRGCRASRRDDVESMGLTLMRFVCGPLPWEKNDSGYNILLSDEEKDQRKCKAKEDFIHSLIDRKGDGAKVHPVWQHFWLHVEALEFAQDPGIPWIRAQFYDLIRKEGIKIKPKKLQIFAKDPAPGSWGNLLLNARPDPYKGRPTIDMPTWGQVLRDHKVDKATVPPAPVQAGLLATPMAGHAPSPVLCSRLNPNAPSFVPSTSASNGRLPGQPKASRMVRDESGSLVAEAREGKEGRAERGEREDPGVPTDPTISPATSPAAKAEEDALWANFEKTYGKDVGTGPWHFEVSDSELDRLDPGRAFLSEKKRLKLLAKKRKKAAKEAKEATDAALYKGMGRGIKAARGAAANLPGTPAFLPAPPPDPPAQSPAPPNAKPHNLKEALASLAISSTDPSP